MPLFEPGLPAGGDPGHFLAKIDGTDFNTEWIPAPYSNYVYSPSGTQSGNVYTNFGDMYAAMQEVAGPKTITFTETCTLPVGAYDMSNVQWNGDFIQASVQVELPTGFTISNATNMQISKGLLAWSSSTAPIITVSTGLTLQVDTAAAISTTVSPFVFVEDTAGVFVLGLGNGGAGWNSSSPHGGYEIVEIEAGFSGFCGISLSTTAPVIDNNTFRSTTASVLRLIQTTSIANFDSGSTQVNLAGGIFDLYFTTPKALAYAPTTLTDWEVTPINVQEGLDILASRRQIFIQDTQPTISGTYMWVDTSALPDFQVYFEDGL